MLRIGCVTRSRGSVDGLDVTLADQDFTFVDPAVGAGASAINTLAREFDELLLFFDEYGA